MIESLGRPAYLQNPQLIGELLKMTHALRREWARWKQFLPDGGTLRDLSDWMRGEADLITLVNVPVGHSDPKRQDPEKNDTKAAHKLFATAEKYEEVKGKREFPRTRASCVFCENSGHNVELCHSFAQGTVDERWMWTQEKLLCFKCLERGHARSNCEKTAKWGVKQCLRPHHRLLHLDMQRSWKSQRQPQHKEMSANVNHQI